MRGSVATNRGPEAGDAPRRCRTLWFAKHCGPWGHGDERPELRAEPGPARGPSVVLARARTRRRAALVPPSARSTLALHRERLNQLRRGVGHGRPRGRGVRQGRLPRRRSSAARHGAGQPGEAGDQMRRLGAATAARSARRPGCVLDDPDPPTRVHLDRRAVRRLRRGVRPAASPRPTAFHARGAGRHRGLTDDERLVAAPGGFAGLLWSKQYLPLRAYDLWLAGDPRPCRSRPPERPQGRPRHAGWDHLLQRSTSSPCRTSGSTPGTPPGTLAFQCTVAIAHIDPAVRQGVS